MTRTNGKNGTGDKRIQKPKVQHEVSELGQKLRAISDKALASGTKVLSVDEINRLVCEARGGIQS